MYLKRIDIHGFKSFADEVKIEFEPNITAVLGPNGSGKSNIADAIRWVLGEQSAKLLRGAKMEDVIFAGSNQRQPLGIAEVKLVLDNSQGELPIEYNEVTIGRRVSRSGESDYLLNNSICRLKDIQELIIGTGMAKESYSIIGQGRVDSILSEKTAERREVFEETAGITKHKQRKEEAAQELAETEQNLQRITDIIGELEKQLGPLEEEAAKARKYRRLYGELENLEVNLLLNRYSNLATDLEEVEQKYQHLEKKVTQTEKQVADYDLEMESLNSQLKSTMAELEEKKDEVYQAEGKVERTNNKIQILAEKRSNANYRLEQLAEQLTEVTEELNKLEAEKQKQEKQLAAVESKLTNEKNSLVKQEEQLKQTVEQLELQRSKRQEAEQSQQQQLREINQKQNQLEQTEYRLEDLRKELSKEKEQLSEKEELLAELRAEKSDLAEQVDTTKEELEAKKAELESEKQQQQQLEQELKELQEQYNQLKSKENNLNSQLDVLKEMQRKYQGYYRGVKQTLKHQRENPNFAQIYGVVAELLQVPQQFEQAVEMALGSKLQNIVVAEAEDAKQAISYLKKQGAGRATFLPLDLVQPRSLRQREAKVLQKAGVYGTAAELVDYDSRFAPAMKNLLGRLLIVEDLDVAVAASQKTNQRVRIVTLKGEIVNPGGSVTGGSSGQNKANLLGRSRQIEELEVQLADLTEELAQVQKEGLGLKEELVAKEEGLEQTQKLLHRLEIQLAEKTKDWQQLEQEVSRVVSEKEQLSSQLEELNEKEQDLKEQRQDLKQDLENLSAQDSIEGGIDLLEEKIVELETAKEKLQEEITDSKVQIAAIEQEKLGLKKEVTRVQASLDKLKRQLETKQQEKAKLKERRQEIAVEKKQLATAVQEAEAARDELRGQLNGLNKQKEELTEEITELESGTKGIRDKLAKLQKKLNNYEVEKAQLKIKLDNIVDKLSENYELQFTDQLLEDKQPIMDYQAVEKRIAELKEAISKLGHVNLGAEEEYQTLKERFSFLKQQYQDLIEAKESLTTVISEIDTTMEEKFVETFEQIKKEFEQIFTELFGGGQAQLELAEPDDLLTTGIEINAQPPGKKLQKLSLMSGGERALTAIALIFALLKVRPSPFYVLDEIDAPLDEANVDRFADYLRGLSARAQFILITHRKGTMEAADALYGVTMQESGVSKLVSLKLSELAS
ncbi:chromosome segregation protein SMC [Fuchsiella alkaliacetigena]|uniref:chromosome segregation protein SMC n=1 Tax=Fuchsiella alkaliacetigena TaxID=957042 RepID=UPI00200B7983|nr:chromosome segregation protein SMC [Fuchsiella alkaliacetigena]MCK8825863.1 chromosome segregation protein SMC [Fuchsiella alkaliacetigena]